MMVDLNCNTQRSIDDCNIKSRIYLCGTRSTALIAEAVGSGIAVGTVRFDVHPGLGNVSGDTIFD